MGDLIRRDDVIKAIHGYWYNKMKELPSKPIGDDEEVIIDTRKANEYLEHNKQLSLFIQLIKAVEVVEPKHGRWEPFHQSGELGYKCSFCNRHAYGVDVTMFGGDYNYCPHCGARMENE